MNTIPSIESADHGFGTLILNALREINSPDNDCLNGLNGRKSSDFVFRMPESDDMRSLFRELAGAKGVSKRLPMMAYSRARSFRTVDPSEAVNMQFEHIRNAISGSHLDISMTWMEFTYTVFSLASNRAAAETMMLGWHFYISQVNKGHHRVPVAIEVQGEELSTNGYIIDSKRIVLGDMSIPEHKLFGFRSDFVVQLPVFYGSVVEAPKDITVTFDILQVV